MVDAPEKIWIEQDDCPYFYEESELTEVGSPVTEYVRADRIEALERENAELRAEVAEHKRLKNQLVLKAYPAMDAIDEMAEGFRSAVHFVRNNAMDMERDYPEICHAEEVFSRVRAALSGSGAGWRDMESAPKDWADVLLYVPNLNSDWRNVCEGYFDAENVTWRSPMFGEIAPTHWMPLPSAPDRRPA